jgi:carboxyl-terminal processing protease
VKTIKLIMGFYLILCTAAVAEARPASCRDAYTLTIAGTNLHVNNPSVDGKMVEKAAPVYLDFKDPFKIMLTSQEVEATLALFKGEEVLNKLKQNDCSGFNFLDEKVKAGEKRWKELLKAALNDEKVKEAKEIIRDAANLKPLANEQELIDYSRYFVAQYFKLEEAGEKKKTAKEIKDNFIKTYLTEKKKGKKHAPENQANLITRALFLAMDPHSDYIPDEQASNFKMAVSANLQGIGLMLKEDELGAKIIKVIKNGPADLSGKFKAGDLIIRVDGKSVTGMPVDEIVDLIRGKENTKVKIEVSHKDPESNKITKQTVTLTRAVIALEEQRVKAEIKEVSGKRVMILNVPSFYGDGSGRGTAYDTIQAYRKLKSEGRIDLIVMDLRNDGGGLLDESIRMVGLFVNEAVAVQVKSKEGVRHFKSSPAPIAITEPTVVLINRYSASASEILAGALKDYHRAVIVGDERTYGKGTVQSVMDNFQSLNLGMMKVTSGQFFTPGGSSTQFKGVTSQVIIPSLSNLQDMGEMNQRYALPWAQVDSALPPKLPVSVDKLIPDLAKKSKARINANEEFKKFADMPTYRKAMELERAKANAKDEDLIEDNRFDLKKDIVLNEAVHIGIDYLAVK